MDDLPFEVGHFELVASSFGLIFAADPQGVLAEVRRVLRPEGRLVFSAWTPAGFIGAMTARIGDLLDVRDMMMGPFRWGDPQVVTPWLTQGFTRVRQEVHAMPWVFPSASVASAFFFGHSPGHLAALEMAGDRAEEVVHEVTAWLGTLAGPDGRLDVPAEYAVTTAQRG